MNSKEFIQAIGEGKTLTPRTDKGHTIIRRSSNGKGITYSTIGIDVVARITERDTLENSIFLTVDDGSKFGICVGVVYTESWEVLE